MSATDRLIGTDEPSAWRAALEGVPHSFYASWECCHAVALNTGRPTWLYVGERAGVRVVCPFSVRMQAGALDWVTPAGFSGFASNGPWPGFAAHWAAFARAQGAVCGYIAQHPAFGHPSLEEAVAGEEDAAKWNRLKYQPVDYAALREESDRSEEHTSELQSH